MKTKKDKSKSKSKSKQNKEQKPKIHLFESDSIDGPWTEITDGIEMQVCSLDEARLENPLLNWLLPVDLMTELYDPAMGVKTGIESNQLEFLRKFFGDNFTLNDVQIWLEPQNLKIERLGFLKIIKLVEQEIKAPKTNGKSKEIKGQSSAGNISGMRWQDAQTKAEGIVDESGWKGFGKLQKAVGCKSKRTLRKAIDNSEKLTKAEAQYKAMPRSLKAVDLTPEILATYQTKIAMPTQRPEELSENGIDEMLAKIHAQVRKEYGPQAAEKFKEDLNKMPRENQIALARTYKNTPIFQEPRKPRQYKEV